MSFKPLLETVCPIPFAVPGETYQSALGRSENLAKFLRTVTVSKNINRGRCTSTDPELDKLLENNVFPDYGRMFYPVVIMAASAGGSGKDTFIRLASHHLKSHYTSGTISTVDPIKPLYNHLATALQAAYKTVFSVDTNPAKAMFDMRDQKSEEYRQFLHDVKDAWTKLNNGPVMYCLSQYIEAVRCNLTILEHGNDTDLPVCAIFINNRDLDTYNTMKDWCYQMGIMCIGVKVNGIPQASDYHNTCDANVDLIPYDVEIVNKSSLEDLDHKTEVFAQLLMYGISRYGVEIDSRISFNAHRELGTKNIADMKD